ncbi:MAG: HEPN domain-containing protein [Chitinivibrionales bacterium]|nr:HEPN domain-containing protein [Chitinivibrionales bacterium]
MNDRLDEEILSYWDRAEESITAARELFNNSHFDFAASRAYYAAFYAASAVLLRAGNEFTKHSAVVAAIHKTLVKTGVISPDIGKKLNRLFELRSIGDYGMMVHVPRPDAEKAVQDAQEILAVLKKI